MRVVKGDARTVSTPLVHELEEKMPYSIALFVGAFLPNFGFAFALMWFIDLLIFGGNIQSLVQLSLISGIGWGVICTCMDMFIM